MRLLFPNGEHGPVELKQGVLRVGSAAGSDVALVAPGIAAQHCEIELNADGARVRVPEGPNIVLVNGKQVAGESALKAGDLVLFAKIGARVVSVERVAAPAAAAARKPDTEADDGRTRIRMALPRFVLRGVSGSTFGKTFPLYGTMTVGRHSDCEISIPGEEISRHHARLKVMPDGISVEDIGSANGTFINGKRVTQGTLKAGEELRLDTVRFLLVAPGLEAQAAQAKPGVKPGAAAPAPAARPSRGVPGWVFPLVGALLVAAAVAGLYYGGVLK